MFFNLFIYCFRIIELIKPFDMYKVTDFKGVNPSWVEVNADPEFQKLKWNTELPDWILSAIHDLIKCKLFTSFIPSFCIPC